MSKRGSAGIYMYMCRYTTVLYSVHPLITTELGPILTLASLNTFIFSTIRTTKSRCAHTICPRSLDLFSYSTYEIKWVKTS